MNRVFLSILFLALSLQAQTQDAFKATADSIREAMKKHHVLRSVTLEEVVIGATPALKVKFADFGVLIVTEKEFNQEVTIKKGFFKDLFSRATETRVVKGLQLDFYLDPKMDRDTRFDGFYAFVDFFETIPRSYGTVSLASEDGKDVARRSEMWRVDLRNFYYADYNPRVTIDVNRLGTASYNHFLNKLVRDYHSYFSHIYRYSKVNCTNFFD